MAIKLWVNIWPALKGSVVVVVVVVLVAFSMWLHQLFSDL